MGQQRGCAHSPVVIVIFPITNTQATKAKHTSIPEKAHKQLLPPAVPTGEGSVVELSKFTGSLVHSVLLFLH